jgi:uncharacterized Fe-S center protein
MKENTVTQYADGSIIRTHNKRIQFIENEGKVVIKFDYATIDAEKPACKHVCHKGVIRETWIKISDEMMEELCIAYLRFKTNQPK